jgi:putative selenate reductase
MNDRFSILPIEDLFEILLDQYESKGSILGISKNLFFVPEKAKSLHFSQFGQTIETPIGVAAGPHTQLAQNIIAAWLTGSRFIELKTIQTLDELEISKPCIDMQDEGYNCEWSQELKVKESFDQYLNAWIIIHVLRHKLFGVISEDPGFIFNMSVGYNFEGILQDNVQWFLDQMQDATDPMNEKLQRIERLYPEIKSIRISPRLSNNITLSTMHGCPPDEIEKIGKYLIREKKLHTVIKLNPTLLGKEKLLGIMNRSGFETEVPDIAFEHDLKFDDATQIIESLQLAADENSVQFGIKLTNTLESRNHKTIFENEEMMYMSGRALHPISTNLAADLQGFFDGNLNISFSGGANADNIRDLYLSGLAPITVCSDLLKPGGFGRQLQYLDNLSKAEKPGDKKAQLAHLVHYAGQLQHEGAYRKRQIADHNLKTPRTLDYFDCIEAPCVSTCPTHQDIPSYLHHTAVGEFEKAYKVIRETNPFPLTTGMICDHLCQNKCVRIHYDHPVQIREVKRFIAEHHQNHKAGNKKTKESGLTASVIGAGPSGLSCAYYLAKNGFEVTVYEAKKDAGGMISAAIPSFRLTNEAIDVDIGTIQAMGVKILYGQHIDPDKFNALREISDFIYIGAGAQHASKLNIKGIGSKGVLDPLTFLFDIKADKTPEVGKNVVIIGGGNTAMDAARTAWRLVGKEGKVTIVYRRTVKQMPADQGEVKAVLEEGIEIIELCSPVEVINSNEKVISLRCQKMKLGKKDATGRKAPVPVDGEMIDIPADTIIPAVGQVRAFDFIDKIDFPTDNSHYETTLPGVFIGGDALRGASTAINAIGDGRLAAKAILGKAGIKPKPGVPNGRQQETAEELMYKKTLRIEPAPVRELVPDERRNFDINHFGMDKAGAIHEASRCLKCDEICNLCATVCPNLAFHGYEIEPNALSVYQVLFENGLPVIKDGADFIITQRFQILHIADWCNACGNCTTFCPTSGAPYKHKPHLYLDEVTFHQEKDGYHYKRMNGSATFQGYERGILSELILMKDKYLYRSSGFELCLAKDDLRIIKTVKAKKESIIDTCTAVKMHHLMKGAMDFFSKQ